VLGARVQVAAHPSSNRPRNCLRLGDFRHSVTGSRLSRVALKRLVVRKGEVVGCVGWVVG
jgi:hypothetical protein